MKKQILTLVIVFNLFSFAKAQYVTLPDSNFVWYLNILGYGACLNGNQLDTTCTNVAAARHLHLGVAIKDFTGIEYFRNLQYLDAYCAPNYILNNLPQTLDTFICTGLHALPSLPSTLRVLILGHDSINSIASFPPALTYLAINYAQITTLPALPPALEYLDVSQLPITTFPTLPSTLKTLIATFGYYGPGSLTTVPSLPAGLEHFDITDQHYVTSLPVLPSSLRFLGLIGVHVTPFPSLPVNLDTLLIESCGLSSLPSLNANLKFLDCWGNSLTSISNLPAGLQSFYFGFNPMSTFPTIPAGLKELACDNINWTSLPALPAALTTLSCYNSNLTSLPSLPATLRTLICSNNHLTGLPSLPDTMHYLSCVNNPDLMCLPHIRYVHQLEIYNTGITCLPGGLEYWAGPSHSSYPICDYFNTNGCEAFWNVGGRIYFDGNNNCTFDSTDGTSTGVKIQLYNNGVLSQQVYSMGLGTYAFNVNGNFTTYTVQVDTDGLPLSIHCPASGYDSAALSPADTVVANVDFAMVCKSQPFDIGIYSLANTRRAIPGGKMHMRLCAGDLSQIYGAHCTGGLSGDVQVIFNGPVTYEGPDTLALTPSSVITNTISWTITDFDSIDNYHDFNFVLNVDTSATLSSVVCFTVSVSPLAGDNNAANNNFTFCIPISASVDPNEKEVYPSGTIDVTQKWLTYTIHFQNTGTAPAQNIYLRDTLDNNFDPASFKLLGTSHNCATQLMGNKILFSFLNIDLPDSATNEGASTGWVQYKIKLRDNLAVGTNISNRASIYFDYNSPVVTNTTSNTIGTITSTQALTENIIFSISLHPNPANSQLYINTSDNQAQSMALYSINGQKLMDRKFEPKIDISNLSPGIYFIEVRSGNELARSRWVKM